MAVQKLREGKRAVGTMVRMTWNPAVAVVAHNAGLDYIMPTPSPSTQSVASSPWRAISSSWTGRPEPAIFLSATSYLAQTWPGKCLASWGWARSVSG